LITGCPSSEPDKGERQRDSAAPDPGSADPDPDDELDASEDHVAAAVRDASAVATLARDGAVEADVSMRSDAAPDAAVPDANVSGSDAGAAASEAGPVDAALEAAVMAPDADSSMATAPDAAPDARPAYASGWGDQPCSETSSKPGCKDDALALCICRGPEAEGGNASCCSKRWDYLCVDGVASVPECKFTTTKCCEAHPGDGCESPSIQQCVCAEVQRMKQAEVEAGRNPASVHDCCTQGWNAFCTFLADGVCGASCPAL
jgi:hypothetical protein